VEPPSGSVLAAPQVQLCFAEEWLPYVIGALKSLCREETWAGNGETDADVIDNARSMIARIGESCLQPPNDAINWQLELEDFYGQSNSWSLINGGPPNTTTTYEGFFDVPDVFGAVDAMFDGRLLTDPDEHVGGLFSDVLLEKQGGMEGPITIISVDCLGHSDTITTVTPYHVSTRILKSIRVLSLVNIHAVVTIASGWLCGPA